jgi:hypothetical protein
MRVSSLVLAAVSASAAAAQGVFKPPGLTFLYNCNVSMSLFLKIGQGVGNTTRALFPISGGEFGNGKISGADRSPGFGGSCRADNAIGKVLSLGGDWLDFDGVNYFVSDSRAHFRTEDGADIYVQMKGKSVPDGVVHVAASFQTATPSYSWLNDIQGVGMLLSTRFGYTVDMYQLQTPKWWKRSEEWQPSFDHISAEGLLG